MFVSLLNFLFAASLFAQANAADVGFSHGNEFAAVPIQGQVQVTCSGFNGEGTATYDCRDVALDPQSYDHFVGPKDPTYRWVDLIATREDGSTRAKSISYDGVRGISKEAINLWLSSIFQKGLLATGKNEISFKIYSSDNGKPAVTGTFQAIVNRSSVRQCPAGSYESSDINDCNSQYSVCQRYFSERQFCK